MSDLMAFIIGAVSFTAGYLIGVAETIETWRIRRKARERD